VRVKFEEKTTSLGGQQKNGEKKALGGGVQPQTRPEKRNCIDQKKNPLLCSVGVVLAHWGSVQRR